MSVAFTEQAVRDRTKTVTRRKGWLFLKPGDRLTLVRKSMGRNRKDAEGRWYTEPLVRIAEVRIVSVRREPLCAIQSSQERAAAELAREGFPGMTAHEFMTRYFAEAQGIGFMDEVTRIEWEYVESVASVCNSVAAQGGKPA